MKLETLNERIAGAEAKIAKKQGTIQKKAEWIAKKTAKLGTMNENDRRMAEWDIDNYQDDIKRLEKEIAETQKTLENYRAQLSGEIEREAILLKDIPESIKAMQAELVEKWDAWDIERRDQLKAEYKELGYEEYRKRHWRNFAEFTFKDRTDKEIHKKNMDDARALILDLYYRVRKITGEITDWTGIKAAPGTCGMTVLNGFVEGKEGRCRIESILAGGYNIQRLHVRVLTHAV